MKVHRKHFAALSALFIITTALSALTVNAETLPEPEDAAIGEASSQLPDDNTIPDEIPLPESDDGITDEPLLQAPEDIVTDEPLLQAPEDIVTDEPLLQTPEDIVTDESLLQMTEDAIADDLLLPAPKEAVPEEAPAFSARIEYSFEGYVVKGTFTEFPPDIIHVLPMYSLDGETWQECSDEWDLQYLDTEDPEILAKLQNQICLYASFEPLNSYLAGTLDCFYLKLRLTKENGTTYESQTTVLNRGNPQPVPEEITLTAAFIPSMCIFEKNPFHYYGKYQLTINADAAPEDIASFLPDTLPMEVQLQKGKNFVAKGIVDCPVTWKPLSLPPLTAGESVLIPDAAEEIIIPSGTLLHTPIGIYEIEDALSIEQDKIITDDVMLVLNVVSPKENPTGVLSGENTGLEMAFDLKPTGATAIRAYVCSENAPEWTALPNLSLLEAVNAQPATANSGYICILDSTQEPYRSYLAAKACGGEIQPFFIGLEIEGGVYNGCRLVLAWPDTYELPPDLPDMWGAGGNENNAGADNKNDSTAEGQRPNLPKEAENETETIVETDANPVIESMAETNADQTTESMTETNTDLAADAMAKTNTGQTADSITKTDTDLAADSVAKTNTDLAADAISKSTTETEPSLTAELISSADVAAIIIFICIITIAAKPMINTIPKLFFKKFRITR